MKSIADIQTAIFEQTGIKTSVKKGRGSTKQYFIISPMFQNNIYPQYSFEWRQKFVAAYPLTEPFTASINGTQFYIHCSFLTDTTPIKYKTERKPLLIEQMKVKQWGSKNSQLRLDKATARNAKRLNAGTTARYY